MQASKEIKSKALTPLITIFLLAKLTSNLFAGDYSNEANFKQIYTDTLNGDISATGSSVICADKNGKCDWNYSGYLYNIDPLTLHDGNTTAFPKNSGRAKITMPANVKGSDIKWARLYWQGHIFGLGNHSSDFTNAINGRENITMLDPKGNLHNLTANASDVYYYGYDKKSVYGKKTKGYRYFYQASKDVTDIVKQSYDSTHNYFIVGNINTTMTKDTYFIEDTKQSTWVKWGNWGGWALVVVYKDTTTTTKNISLYDGFKFLLPPFTAGAKKSLQIDLPANSFYTPKYGTVKSKTIMFSAGAEKQIKGNKLEMQKKNGNWATLSNSLNPTDNQMNDSITYLGNQINPNRIFNAGTDLDTYDSSGVLNNAQTTTSLKVTMLGDANSVDQAFVGLIGISNDIYKPNICYNETLYNSKNIKLDNNSTVSVGDNIRVELLINNNDLETATNVQIIKKFDTNITSYDANSTTVRNINDANYTAQTDIFADDLVDFNSTDSSLRVRIGTGANSSQGGVFNPNDTAYLDFNTTLNTDKNISFAYDTSYVFSIAGKQFTVNGTLPKCTDFNNTITPSRPQLGSFNVVHYPSSITTIDPLDANDPKNALYTQIVNKDFNVTVIHVGNDNKTLKPTSGVVFLDVVDASTLNLIYRLPGKDYPIFFGDSTPNSQTSTQTVSNIKIPKVAKNATFRINYIDWNQAIHNSGVTCTDVSNMSANLPGVPACLDSGNQLDIVFPGNLCRSTSKGEPCLPSKHGIGTISPYNHTYGCAECLVDYNASHMYARDNFAIRPKEFNIDINGTAPRKAGENYTFNFLALNDNNTSSANYNETIGTSFKIDINETNSTCLTGIFTPNIKTGWSFSDGNYTIQTKYSEVGKVNIRVAEINGSEFASVDQKDTSDTLRLITPYDKNLTFTPDHFDINASLTSSGQTFTYISNNLNMAATLDINITAKTKNGTTTKNYNSVCYAQKTDYNISYSNLPSNALTKILYKETNTSTEGNSSINSNINLTNIPNSVFSTDNNGTGSIHVKINFDRNSSKAVNPFKLNITDINVTDTNNIKGDKNLDSNTTFYYGRVHAPDYKFQSAVGNATIYYEVYCKECNRTDYNITGNESVDSIDWYTNTLHANSDGNVTYLPLNANTSLNRTNSINTANGKDGITITVPANSLPYKDKIDFNPSSSWLIYNPTDFMIEFYKKGSWAGQGKLGKTVDLNVSTIQNQRIDW